MNLPALAIGRPVTTIMAVALIVFVGLVSLAGSSTDLLPEMTMPIVMVLATYEGAGAREVESLVTRPIEQALGYVAGVERISSESSEGLSVLTAEFSWGTNIDTAVLDIRDSIELVKSFLPDDVSTPRIIKADISLLPTMRLALAGPYDPLELTRHAEKVRARLERIEGLASAEIGGGVYEEVRVEVDPTRMLTHGLTLPQISSTLRTENLNLPGGQIDEAGKRLVLRTQGRFTSVEDVAAVNLTTAGGGVVTLADVAGVRLVQTETAAITRLNGEPAVTISVRKQSGENTVAVASAVRSAIAELADGLPPDLEINVVEDQSEFITEALRQVSENIAIGGVLAVVVLFLFLMEVRTVAVIALAIPVSLLSTFAFMYFAGLTLNLISLGGLALGVGMLVDNAIVILENIYRHRQKTGDARLAAATGAQEVGMAVTASTVTTVAVFIPVVFIKGLASQVFRELALTVSFALASSLFVALSFVPMAASSLLRAGDRSWGIRESREIREGPGDRENRESPWSRLAGASLRVQSALRERYSKALAWSLDHRRVILVVVAVIVLAGVGTVTGMPQTLLPDLDQRQVNVTVRLPKGTSLDRADRIIHELEEIVFTRQDIAYAFVTTGDGGGFFGGDPDTATMVVKLHPLSRGMASTGRVVAELRRAVADVPGAELSVSAGSGLVGEDRMFGAPLAITLAGDDVETLIGLGETVAAAIGELEGIINVRTTLVQAAPEAQVVVDRQRAAQVGLNGAYVATVVRAAVEGQVATAFRLHDADVDVRVIFPEESRRQLADIESLWLPSPTGRLVSVGEVAEVTRGTGPTSVQRRGGARIAEVQADLSGISLQRATALAKDRLASLALPPGYTIEYGGESQEISTAFGDLGQALVMALVLIYMVMASQFESVRQPLIVMVTVPLALAGAVIALAATGEPLSIPSLVGVIALTGVVVNNGIVLIDYANQLRARGLPLREAVAQAGAVRLRPILMTSLTTIIALLPMAVLGGQGNELQRSLSVPLLGGMALSTFLTLFVVPVLYSYVVESRGVDRN